MRHYDGVYMDILRIQNYIESQAPEARKFTDTSEQVRIIFPFC